MPLARWIKAVNHIKGRGKTGHDWIGDWLARGELEEVEIGELVAAAFETFEEARGVFDRVRLFGVVENGNGGGTLIEWACADGPGWSKQLRRAARKYLEMDIVGRLQFLRTLNWIRSPEVRRKYKLEDGDDNSNPTT